MRAEPPPCLKKSSRLLANINSKYPVGVAQPAAVVGLLEAGVPKKNMPKLTKSDQKVVKMEPRRVPREHFWMPEAQDGRQGGKKTDFDAQKCAPRVPKWVTKGSKNALKRCLKTSCFLDPFFESFWPAFEVKMRQNGESFGDFFSHFLRKV